MEEGDSKAVRQGSKQGDSKGNGVMEEGDNKAWPSERLVLQTLFVAMVIMCGA